MRMPKALSEFHLDFQTLLRLAAVDREHPVALDFGHGFAVIFIHFVRLGVFLVLDEFCGNFRLFQKYLTQFLSQLRVVGNPFGNDVFCAVERLFHRIYALFFVDVGFGQIFRRSRGDGLRLHDVRERFQPLGERYCRARLFLCLYGR